MDLRWLLNAFHNAIIHYHLHMLVQYKARHVWIHEFTAKLAPVQILYSAYKIVLMHTIYMAEQV